MRRQTPLKTIQLSGSSSEDHIISPVQQRILKRLTLSLQDLYKHIQQKSNRQKAFLVKGQLLKNRYKIQGIKGRGSFGIVIWALDLQTNTKVAIKIIKSKPYLQRSGCREISILKYLKQQDHERGFVVQILDNFVWNDQTCIVLEHLDKTLFQIITETHYKGISLCNVRVYAWQLLHALTMFSHPTNNIVHCDLKPENIMVKQVGCAGIKIIDFGSSCKSGQERYRYVQSRYYRAPEVLYNLRYGTPIDMWSLGCTLIELHIGRPLFKGENREDQIIKIAGVKGYPPHEMFRNVENGKQIEENIRETISQVIVPYTTLSQIVNIEKGGPGCLYLNDENHSIEIYKDFVDIIERMLEYDPVKRLKPFEALRHPFFQRAPDSFKFQIQDDVTKFALENRSISNLFNPDTYLRNHNPHYPILIQGSTGVSPIYANSPIYGSLTSQQKTKSDSGNTPSSLHSTEPSQYDYVSPFRFAGSTELMRNRRPSSDSQRPSSQLLFEAGCKYDET